jgi:hypothetical protein
MTPSAQESAPHTALRQELDSLDHAKPAVLVSAGDHRRDGEEGLVEQASF